MSALDEQSADHERIPSLDGVRGVAILIVLIHNSAFILHGSTAFLPKLVSAVAVTGWIGVQLFFVLSGFLITGILLGTRNAPRYFRDFYVRRTLRIFPLYYSFLIVAFLVVPYLVDAPRWVAEARANQGWYWTYMSNWGSPFNHNIRGMSHFWSLAVEEQFYLVWPLTVFLLVDRSLVALCGGIILTAPLVRLGLTEAGLPRLAAYEFTVARWDALACGAVLALLMRGLVSERRLRRGVDVVGAAALAALAVLVAVEHGFHEDDVSVQVVGQTLISLLGGWLVYRCAAPPAGSRVGDVASARWLRFFGKYSYAIYVFHYPIHRLGVRYLTDIVNGADSNWRVARLAGYVGLVGLASTLAAMISWRLLEKPFLDLKERFAPRRIALQDAIGVPQPAQQT